MSCRCRSMASTVAVLTGLLNSGAIRAAAEDAPTVGPAESPVDALGDPLPSAALWRMGTTRFGHPDDVGEMGLSPDGKTVITIGRSWMIAWDAETGREKWRHDSGTVGTRSVGASYGQRLLAFAADNRSVYLPRIDGDIARCDLATGAIEVIDVRKDDPPLAAPGDFARAVDITPDGSTLAVGSLHGVTLLAPDGAVRFRIPNAPQQALDFNSRDRLTFGGHSCLVKFSRAGRILAAVLSEAPQEIRLIDPATGQELRRIQLEQNLVRLDFSPDDSRIVATERDNATRMYNVATGERLWSHIIPPQGNAECYTCGVAFNSAGDLIAVCAPIGSDYGIRLLNSANGEEVGKLNGHTWKPWHVAFSPDDQTLYSAGWDGPVRRWNVAERQQLPPPGGFRAGSGIAASPDGRRLAFTDDSGTVHLLDAADYHEIRTLSLPGTTYGQLVFSSDSAQLAGGGPAGDNVHVALWNVADGALVQRWDWPKGRDPHSEVEALAFHPAGDRLGVAVFRQDAAYILDVASGQRLAEIQHVDVYGLDFNPDGQTVGTVGWDKAIRTWDARSGAAKSTTTMTEENFAIPNGDSRMYGIAYAPVGGLMATAHMSGQVSVWDRDMNLLWRFDAGWFTYGTIAFSRDGSLLATGDSGGNVKVWDPLTGELLWDKGRHEHYAYVVGFMPDGLRLFSSGSDNVNYVWDLQPDAATEPRSGDELWNDLSGEGAAAYRAMWQLTQSPDVSIPLLEQKLQQIETLVDLKAALEGLDGEAALRRQELTRKMLAKNPTLAFDATIRRGVAALRRIHSPTAREALTRLASDGKCPAVRGLADDALERWD